MINFDLGIVKNGKTECSFSFGKYDTFDIDDIVEEMNENGINHDDIDFFTLYITDLNDCEIEVSKLEQVEEISLYRNTILLEGMIESYRYSLESILAGSDAEYYHYPSRDDVIESFYEFNNIDPFLLSFIDEDKVFQHIEHTTFLIELPISGGYIELCL